MREGGEEAMREITCGKLDKNKGRGGEVGEWTSISYCFSLSRISNTFFLLDGCERREMDTIGRLQSALKWCD